MLKTTRSLDSTQKNHNNKVVGGGGNDKNLSKSKKLKNAKFRIQTCIGVTGEPTFLTSDTKEDYNQLKQVFTKTQIFWHFCFECHIGIEIDTSDYAIRRVLSQLTSDYLTSNQS